jgi:hypothetical protein
MKKIEELEIRREIKDICTFEDILGTPQGS